MTPLLFSVGIPTRLAIFWRKHLARTSRMLKTTGSPKSIIVFRLDQLGDLVLTTPLFRELRRNFPNARCTVVVRPSQQSILTTNRNVDEILPLHEVKARLLPARARWLVSALWFYWTRLRDRQFDIAISPRWDVDESLATMLCVLSNADMRVGRSEHVSDAKRRINRGFDAAFDVSIPSGTRRHEVDRNLEVIAALGGRVEDRSLEICLAANDRKFGAELLTHHDRRRLLVAIGIGGRAASRRWPLDQYADVITRLNRNHAVQPVIACGREEEADASELAGMLPVQPYILSGVPLRAVCAVLERCDLFVGNDSGTAHLAAAMDCPTIVVSKHPRGGDPDHANSPVRFAPRGSRYRVVQPESGADGCRVACRATEPHCIKLVTVEMVLAAVSELSRSDCRGAIQHELPRDSTAQAGLHLADDGNILEAASAL